MNNKSDMTVLRDVYPVITSFDWLEKAYRKARKQKRYRNEILAFSSDLDNNLLTIQSQMLDGTFKFGPYIRHWVYIPKRRLVMALPFPSRIVQWSIYLILNPFYDRLMIEDSYACRIGKGSLAAALRLQYWLQLIQNKPGSWYCLKMDISKFFYRVDHAVLLDILKIRIKDRKMLVLLDSIINCDNEKFGLPRFASPENVEAWNWLSDVGMPIGNLTSQLFANIYLNELDQYCKHVLHIRFYIRYMDDIIVLAKSKGIAHSYREKIEKFLNTALHLDLNSKTSIRPTSLPIEFVGYSVKHDELKLRKKSIRHLKSSFRRICRQYFAGEISKEDFDRRVASFKGIIGHISNDGITIRLNEIYIHAKEKDEKSSS
jgi:retron-type reverse transcriptase